MAAIETCLVVVFICQANDVINKLFDFDVMFLQNSSSEAMLLSKICFLFFFKKKFSVSFSLKISWQKRPLPSESKIFTFLFVFFSLFIKGWLSFQNFWSQINLVRFCKGKIHLKQKISVLLKIMPLHINENNICGHRSKKIINLLACNFCDVETTKHWHTLSA